MLQFAMNSTTVRSWASDRGSTLAALIVSTAQMTDFTRSVLNIYVNINSLAVEQLDCRSVQ